MQNKACRCGIALVSLFIIGVFATVGMDLWNVVLYFWIGNIPDWHLVGRGLGYLAQGNFSYARIPNLPAIPGESSIGWVAHYFIGFFYTFLYLFLIGKIFKTKPKWYSAVIFAWIVMIFPFLILEPVMGLGVFSSLSGDPWMSRLITFSFHTVFGLSLYVGYLFARSVFSHVLFIRDGYKS